jgi:hypothetical protein
MSNRRSFINKAGLLTASALTANLFQPAWSRDLQAAIKDVSTVLPSDLASDEDFWYYVQQSYTIAPNFINLNNGGVGAAPPGMCNSMKR